MPPSSAEASQERQEIILTRIASTLYPALCEPPWPFASSASSALEILASKAHNHTGMNRLIAAAWRRSRWPTMLISALGWAAIVNAQATGGDTGGLLLTKVTQLREAIKQGQGRVCVFALEGTILAADSQSGTLFFQDGSGTEILEAKLNDVKFLPGQIVRLRGTNYVTCTTVGLSLGTHPVVDADGPHSATERSGTVYLRAGRQPLQLKWFNQRLPDLLRVEYSSDRLRRGRIPDSALFQAESILTNGEIRWLSGLNYRAFEGRWENLPDFDSLLPVKSGVAPNFDIKVETRAENVGLEFKGFLNVTDDGNYTFYLGSDDGGQLFLDTTPPEVGVIGTTAVPDPTPIAGGQFLPDNPYSLWGEAEGAITSLGRQGKTANFVLMSGESRIDVEILSSPIEAPIHLQHCRARVRGVCPDIRNSNGQRYAGKMVVADWQAVHVLDIAPENWSMFSNATIDRLRKLDAQNGNSIVRVHGHLTQAVDEKSARFEDGTGSALIELLSDRAAGAGVEVECLSRWSRSGTEIFLHEAVLREATNDQPTATQGRHVLTSALEVQQLTHEQAQSELPVNIQGIVTWVSGDYKSLVVQDSTRAVYVWVGEVSSQSLPQVGDYSRIEGVSRPGNFAPIVALRRASVLWKGQMPVPTIPTRDQLLSGTLDDQYVEIRGLVTATHDDFITLLTPEGMLDFKVTPELGEQWGHYLNFIIRVRGCLFANWDRGTHRVVFDHPFNFSTATIAIDTSPPRDPFQADNLRAEDLLKFDARFDTFRRVKLTGQIIHAGADINYMMDDTTGLRFRLSRPVPLEPGDQVEVVGMVVPGGASSMIRQAVVRKTGHAPLPKARRLSLSSPEDNGDSTLVWLEGTLMDLKNYRTEQVLELQIGTRSFAARLASSQHPAPDWPLGSRLKLTGVFCALGGNQLTSRDLNSFELLLNSAADVQVVALPPWWTLQRLLAAVAVLIMSLVLAFIWIFSLRRQVERRTRQLHREISHREQMEESRAIEQERSRIARDLHDNLGSELTEINMMASTAVVLKIGPDAALERLHQIVETSRAMISSLDSIVWFINSKNDKLTELIEYLANYTEEFLGKAEIACRMDLPINCPEQMIEGGVRHGVLLSVKETLNNAVCHGHPSAVLLQIKVSEGNLEILINDNGCGFEPNMARGNGLANLHQRMNKFGGSCHIQSSPSSGTSVFLILPLRK